MKPVYLIGPSGNEVVAIDAIDGQTVWKKLWHAALLWLMAVCLIACGGGSSGGHPLPMSSLQSRFDAWIQAGSVAGLSWNLHSPTRFAGDYLFAWMVSTTDSPQSGAQPVSVLDENLTTSLTVPASSTRSVQRLLVNGVIRYRHAGSSTMVAYVENVIESRFYATDDQTLLYTEVLDEATAPTPLTGTLADNTVFNRQFDLAHAPAPSGLSVSTPWGQDAAYLAVKTYFRDPLWMVNDWSLTTYDANVNAYAGAETTIEAFFANHPTWTYGGNSYTLGAGSIQLVDGVRVWRANTALPLASYPTTSYRTLIELGQKLYAGLYYPAGTRLRYRDQIDNTQQLDSRLMLNRAALRTLQQAVSF